MRAACLCVLWCLLVFAFGKPVDRGIRQLQQSHEAPLPQSQQQQKQQQQQQDLQHITVHVVPHSHQDVGWLRSVDQYFTEEVVYVYDSVIPELIKDPSRRFISVEMAFFARWWKQQTNTTRANVNGLIARLQLEFVLGGWCMHDEAVTHHFGQITQMTQGQEWLHRNVGNKSPQHAWHIDPFGASASSPALMQAMGFKSFVINRIDSRLKTHWMGTQPPHLEFNWCPSKSDPSACMFTHVLDSHYSAMYGFDWEYFSQRGGDDPDAQANIPIVDDATSPSPFFPPNVQDRADNFMSQARQRAQWFTDSNNQITPTSNLLVPFGDDFKWQSAHIQYSNFERLAKFINENPLRYNATVVMSTLQDFFTASEAERTAQNFSAADFEKYEGDFFPYATDEFTYWVGFYTSRPKFKALVREGEAMLRRINPLLTLTRALQSKLLTFPATAKLFSAIAALRRAVSVAQHHDAVTGTETEAVIADYSARLQAGIHDSLDGAADVFAHYTKTNISANISEVFDSFESSGTLNLFVFNSLAWARSEVVSMSVPVDVCQKLSATPFGVVDADGNCVSSQLSLDEKDQDGGSECRLFVSVTLDPFQNLALNLSTSAPNGCKTNVTTPQPVAQGVTIENKCISVTFSADGFMQSITTKSTNTKTDITQDFLAYISNDGPPTVSQAYIAIFNSSEPLPLRGANGANPSLSTVGVSLSSSVAVEVRQQFAPGTLQIVRLVSNPSSANWVDAECGVQLETVLQVQNDNREVVTRFWTPSLNNVDPQTNLPQLFTDANGLELRERTVNRTSWDPTAEWFKVQVEVQNKSIPANYYPMTAAAALRDTNNDMEMQLLTQRSHGCTAGKGMLEVMFHRRCSWSLNDTTVVRDFSWLTVMGDRSNSSYFRRTVHHKLTTAPIVLFSSVLSDGSGALPPALESVALPDSVNLYSLDVLPATDFYDGVANQDSPSDEVLLRVHQIYEAEEHAIFSNKVAVDIGEILAPQVEIQVLEETTLTGIPLKATASRSATSDNVVVLGPMQFKSFRVKLFSEAKRA